VGIERQAVDVMPHERSDDQTAAHLTLFNHVENS